MVIIVRMIFVDNKSIIIISSSKDLEFLLIKIKHKNEHYTNAV